MPFVPVSDKPRGGRFVPVGGQVELTNGTSEPDLSNLRDDVEFAGIDAEKTSSILPRTAKAFGEGEGYGKQALAAGLDLLSLPGRALGSLPEAFRMLGKEGEERTEAHRDLMKSLSQTEGEGLGGTLLRDPATAGVALTAPVSAPLAGVRAGAGIGARLGAGALAGLTEGAVGAGIHQAEDIGKGQDFSLKEAAIETGLGGLTGGVAPGLGAAATGAKNIIKKGIESTAEQLSGVPAEALKKYGTGLGKGAQELSQFAGKEREIGQKVLDALDNVDDILPEKAIVDEAIETMPNIPVQKTLDALESAKPSSRLQQNRAVIKQIDDMKADIAGAANQKGEMSASDFRALRQDIDKLIDDGFGKETNTYINSLKSARAKMAGELVNAAEKTGDETYVNAMKSMADKLKKVDKVKQFLGKNAGTRENRIEAFISTLFGKNKGERQKAIKELGEIFGDDWLKEARLAQMASQLGPEGKAALLPRQFTGRSLLGPALAGGAYSTGQEELAVPALALSSPRLAAGLLGTAAKTSRLGSAAARRLPSTPELGKRFILREGLNEMRGGRR